MRHVVFICHGKIWAKSNLVKKIRREFSYNFRCIITFTSKKGDAKQIVAEHLNKGYLNFIIVGGDGTINEVINGIMSIYCGRLEMLRSIRLGILPMGSGNDFAKTIGSSNDFNQLHQLISNDQYFLCDLGKLTFNDHEFATQTAYFINIADLGIGGLVAKIINKMPKFLHPGLAYQLAIMTALIQYKHKKVMIKIAGIKAINEDIMALVIANGRFFGSGLGIAPNAMPSDGYFNIIKIGKIGLLDYFKQIRHIKKSRIIDHPEVKYFIAKELDVESQVKPLPLDVDGEYYGFTPIKASVLKNVMPIWSVHFPAN